MYHDRLELSLFRLQRSRVSVDHDRFCQKVGHDLGESDGLDPFQGLFKCGQKYKTAAVHVLVKLEAKFLAGAHVSRDDLATQFHQKFLCFVHMPLGHINFRDPDG